MMRYRPLMTICVLVVNLTLATDASWAAEFRNVDPQEVGLAAERLARIDPVLESYVANGRLAGAVTFIVRRGALVHNKAYGYRDLEAGEAMRPDSLFRIASQTKAIVSVAVLILQERGPCGGENTTGGN